MKKAPEAFRTISEVSDLLDTPQHILRFWESKFYQIRPVKRAGGRRYYRPDDVALLNGIRILLQEQGLPQRAVQRLMQEKGLRHVIELGSNLPERPPGAPAPQDEAEVPEGEAALADDLPPVAPTPARTLYAVRAPVAAPVAPPVTTPVTTPVAAAAPPPEAPQPAAPLPAALQPEAEPAPAGPRLSLLLRDLPRDALADRRAQVAALVQRIDLLIDRMSDASGAGRW